MSEPTVMERIQAEVQETAEVLLRDKPPGTQISDVWNEALSVHRVRFEPQILGDDRGPAGDGERAGNAARVVGRRSYTG